MTSNNHKIIAFLVGTAICLGVLELSLRVVGIVYEFRSESDKAFHDSAVRRTILCVGDSVTFGLGSSRNQSYPAQLQQLLNKDEDTKGFSVINRGRPGHNSALLLETLEQDIVATKPDMILILIGGANLWNYWGYQNRFKEGRFLSYLNDKLYRIRIYKLVKLLYRNIQSKKRYIGPNHHDSIYAFEPDVKPMRLSKKTISDALNSKSGEAYGSIGKLYMEKGDYDQALHWFREGIIIDPEFGLNYIFIGWLYREQKQHKKALYWFKKGMKVSPPDPLDYHSYDAIASGFFDQDLYSDPIEFYKKEARRNPIARDFLLMYGDGNKAAVKKRVKEWVEKDLKRILSLCEKYKTTTLIQSYPDYWDKELYDLLNDAVGNLSNSRNFYFIDHYRAFTEIIEKGGAHEEYFIPDDHPSTIGYGVMAENILTTLKREAL